MRLPQVLLRLLLLVLACLVALRAAGAERGTVVTLLVGALPLVLLPAYAGVVVGLVRRDRLLAGTGLGLVAAHLLLLAPALGADAELGADAGAGAGDEDDGGERAGVSHGARRPSRR